MPVTEQLILDLSKAQQQIRELDSQLDTLLQPVTVPVELDASGDIQRLRSDLANVDDVQINVNVPDVDLDLERAVREAQQLNEALERTVRETAGVESNVFELVDQFSRAETRAEQIRVQLARLSPETREAIQSAKTYEDRLQAASRAARELANRTDDVGVAASTAGSRFQSLQSAFAVIAGLQVARSGFDFLTAGVTDAAALGEAVNKINVLFGDTADDILAFSENSTAALVSTQTELLNTLGGFGGLASVVGLTTEEAAEFATTFTGLSADLASFFDTSPLEAAEALASGLRGESEPLRRYNVLLNETTVNAKALELGLAGTTAEITEADKVQARYAVIMEQTVVAQGDLLETQDSLSNRLKSTRVDFIDLRRELGEAVVPALEELLEVLPGVIDLIGQAAPVVGNLASVFGDQVDPIAEFAGVLSELTGPLEAVTGFLFGAEGGVQAAFGSFVEFLNPVAPVLREINRAFDEAFPRDAIRIDTHQVQGALVDFDKLGGAVRDVAADIVAANATTAFDTFSVGGADELLLIGDAVQNVNRDLLDFNAAFANLDIDFPVDQLTADFDAITQALADTFDPEGNGEVLTSIDELIGDIQERFAAVAEFESGLAELVSRGFDDAAAVIRERGVEAQGLLTEALADPSKAAELEGVLDSVGTTAGAGYAEGFVIGFDAESPAVARAISDTVDSATVRNGIIAGAHAQALIFAENFKPAIVIDDVTVRIPANVQPFSGGGSSSSGGGGGATPGSPSVAQGAPGVSVTINNPTVTDLDTSVGQASSTLGAISGLVR